MPHPILLCHGVSRFDQLLHTVFCNDNQPLDDLHYFRKIRSTLLKAGFNARHSGVPWASSLEDRSRALLQNVEQTLRETGAPKVNIIAHSMGGLDARNMLFQHRDDRVHEKIASINTIGTPHLGSTFADWGLGNLGFIKTALEKVGVEMGAFESLTTGACKEFNRKTEAFEAECGVRFHTYAGTQPFGAIFEPLKIPFLVIQFTEGENDGLVSLASARWKDAYFKKRINADHLNQCGWWEPAESSYGETMESLEARIQGFYLEIANSLP